MDVELRSTNRHYRGTYISVSVRRPRSQTMADFKEASTLASMLGKEGGGEGELFNPTECRANLRRLARRELLERGILS